MKMSELFGRTSKTEGSEYSVMSHRLLTQGGFIRESTAGRYYLLPLGLKVHDNIVRVVRKHMDKVGAQELIMPTLHPLELWKETNRTTTTGFELMKVKDRRGAAFALGGTAEEMAVDLVRKFNLSYKDLPFTIYQFSTKFRDELRARGGLLRVREFIMKDAYSFSSEEQFKAIYQSMWDAYSSIFRELGLHVDVVAADNGYIGGEYCHEFVSESEVGESRYFIDTNNGYAAHEDVAKFQIENKNVDEPMKEMIEVAAERGATMEDGVKFHGMPRWQQIKDVLYFDEATKRYVLAVIRGDLDVNETKLGHAADAWDLRSATEAEIRDDLGSEPGFISPVGFPKKGRKTSYNVIIVADTSLQTIRNAYGGTNKLHYDALNINIDRDFKPDIEADIALARPNMKSPGGNSLVEKRGIEVGNIFQLGHHYSSLMHDAEYTTQQGKLQEYYMGCYGIGIGRTMAAIVEAHHDNRGIIWPEAIAPFRVYLIGLGDDETVMQTTNKVYSDLTAADIAVIYDNRDVRPGEKFADADLIGVPYRIIVSKKTVAEGRVELKVRSSEEVQLVSVEDIIKKVASI
ncbi:MAG TPA: proline--tRNA ligase [Candidatus Saccharimonadales bacterium]|nr:proline--tRNA ligase [Candidatus Saccharimonadales bacterium]